jgi:hypothetical protein
LDLTLAVAALVFRLHTNRVAILRQRLIAFEGLIDVKSARTLRSGNSGKLLKTLKGGHNTIASGAVFRDHKPWDVVWLYKLHPVGSSLRVAKRLVSAYEVFSWFSTFCSQI